MVKENNINNDKKSKKKDDINDDNSRMAISSSSSLPAMFFIKIAITKIVVLSNKKVRANYFRQQSDFVREEQNISKEVMYLNYFNDKNKKQQSRLSSFKIN